MSYSEVLKIRTEFCEAQSLRNVGAGSGYDKSSSSNESLFSSIKTIFEAAIRKAESAQNNLSVNPREEFLFRRNEVRVAMYECYKIVLRQALSRFELYNIQHNEETIDSTTANVRIIEEISDEGQKAIIQETDETLFEKIQNKYNEQMYTKLEELFPKENEGRENGQA